METIRQTNGLKKIIILAVILILPGFLYYLLEKKGENRYKSLPIYGEKVLTGTFSNRMGKKVPDTLFHEVAPFSLTDQQGRQMDVLANDTSVSVVNFFYTRCETFCEHMNNEMNRVAERFVANKMINFYTITVDTAYDSPAVLNEYAKTYHPESKKWYFLTAGKDDVYDVARNGFLVDALQDTTKAAGFIHSSSLILVDSKRHIRGYYDVNHKKEVDRLIDELKLLLVEEIREKSPL
ncbi:SCO family protein [Parapedobacter indicus]|uniref:Protein SCO1/2 n=1 Tax=Parapedobacter indicus TaxID=1477437 RepID=A0A1I3FKW7_9SPHI|nr:SCO family protein [Parapedobacter indicus]PPL03775.1 protein SCO1/2 [Parapedobacter indicus]SFI11908.1 protein SCO1/2 [Parapedobacter indicus]